MSELLLGVDGGATKTVAVLADASGRVLGAGRSGSSDIHAVVHPDDAVDRVADAARQALDGARVAGGDLAQAAFGLCGADWPEDMALYQEGLSARLGLRRTPIVVNDALGALRVGTPDGVGVSLVIGTGGAIGARGPTGATWFSGMRLEPSGAVELGRLAYAHIMRGAYGAGPVPDFLGAALDTHGVASVEEIAELNILGATKRAMHRALAAIYPPEAFEPQRQEPDLFSSFEERKAFAPTVSARVIVDGLPLRAFPYPHVAFVNGDARSLCIAMASIVAKVARDRMMLELETKFPGYGFAQHKGYGTEEHREAVLRLGKCLEHRDAFLRKLLAVRVDPAQMDFLAAQE